MYNNIYTVVAVFGLLSQPLRFSIPKISQTAKLLIPSSALIIYLFSTLSHKTANDSLLSANKTFRIKNKKEHRIIFTDFFIHSFSFQYLILFQHTVSKLNTSTVSCTYGFILNLYKIHHNIFKTICLYKKPTNDMSLKMDIILPSVLITITTSSMLGLKFSTPGTPRINSLLAIIYHNILWLSSYNYVTKHNILFIHQK